MSISLNASQTPTANRTPPAITRFTTERFLHRDSREINRIMTRIERNEFSLVGTDSTLRETNESIDALHDLGDNWNGYGVLAPNSMAIEHALDWIQSAHAALHNTGYEWLAPHVAADEEGNVVFEWWKGDKKLTLYASPFEVSFVKVWGSNIENEMSEGVITSDTHFVNLWSWLLG